VTAENDFGAKTGRAAIWAFTSIMGARIITLVSLAIWARARR
jgi:hypothetical protein